MLNAFPASLAVLLIASSVSHAQESTIHTNGPVSVEPWVTVELPETALRADPPLLEAVGPAGAAAEPAAPAVVPGAADATAQPESESSLEPSIASQASEANPAASVPPHSDVEPDAAPQPSGSQPSSGGESESRSLAATPLPAIERTPLGQGSLSASGGEADASPQSGLRGIARTGGALAVVLGLILILRFVLVKFSGSTGGLRAQLGAGGKAPSGVLFVLGRYPVSRGMTLVLLQLDQRVLLLSQTNAGFHTLAELSDPEEVASIIRKAKDDSGESLGAKFGSMLKQFERDPATIGDLDPAAESAPVRLRRPVETDIDEPDPSYTRYSGYYEDKPHTLPRTGEDELRSRINRLREYGS